VICIWFQLLECFELFTRNCICFTIKFTLNVTSFKYCFNPFRELWSRSRLASTLAALLSHVAIFISYLSLSKISHNTVSAYLSAITFPCKIAHHEGFANNLLVSKMLEEMRRVHKTVDTCLPIYDTLLGCIIKIRYMR
jgi:hypothetical protein